MGRMSELMIEQEQEKTDKNLAALLGITYDELMEADYEFDEETDNEGNTLNHLVVFKSISPATAKKIAGLNGDTVVIDINAL